MQTRWFRAIFVAFWVYRHSPNLIQLSRHAHNAGKLSDTVTVTGSVVRSETAAVQAREGAKTVWRTGPLESSEQAADLWLNISNTSPDATTYVNEDIEAGWAHPRDAGVECTVTVSEVAISAA